MKDAENNTIINESENNKRKHGQFFTVTNPFFCNPFYLWFEKIPNIENEILLEPFAGANNIIEMIESLGFEYDNKWMCYDIEPPIMNVCPKFPVIKRDTIIDFPKGHNVAITNPPYLAKNSATRRGIPYPKTKYDDLYKLSLDVMLKNLDYVAAIIPESFITSELFHDRLETVISLTCKMFDDTDCPVCLALFSPLKVDEEGNTCTDFDIFRGDKYVGKYSELKKEYPESENNQADWKFNDQKGNIGIKCVDNTKTASIEFIDGEEIDESSIKVSSRAFTRVSGLPQNIDLPSFLVRCNNLLKLYREKTKDVFLTSFKGLREDGYYRRRLDFKTAKNIMNKITEEMMNDENESSENE